MVMDMKIQPGVLPQDPRRDEKMRNSIGILKLISQGENDIRQGNIKPQEDVFKSLEKSLRAKN